MSHYHDKGDLRGDLMSMTGFSRVGGSFGDWQFAFEVRSVNGRGLDIRVRVPNGMEGLDAALRARLAARLARGSINVVLQLARGPAKTGYHIDTGFLDEMVALVKSYGEIDGFRPTSLGELLGLRGVIETAEPDAGVDDGEALQAAMLATFEEAVSGLIEARRAEGAELTRVLMRQVERIAELTAEAEASPARAPDAIRHRLHEQISLLAGQAGLDPQRLHTEVALLATRADIREELDRLKSHVGQVRQMLRAGGPIGRKLDFLAQEFNRESNTLCSKSNAVELTAIGLELKSVVDQFKEQVQNIE